MELVAKQEESQLRTYFSSYVWKELKYVRNQKEKVRWKINYVKKWEEGQKKEEGNASPTTGVQYQPVWYTVERITRY